MPRTKARRAKRSLRGSPRRKRRRLWPNAGTRQRWLRLLRQAPFSVQLVAAVACLLVLWVVANGLYQVVRKPSELFFPISGVLHKTPEQTWRTYKSIFRRHATSVITADFLAALAQVEGSGNPVVRTYWRWAFKTDPFEVYRPASSAVGMYQITNGTFAEARRYCIRDHVVIEDGPWNDWRSCWFNSLYTRVIATHAVELTSAYLDNRVAGILRRQRITSVTLRQKQDLAAIIHLCGAGAAARYARRGLRLLAAQKCGDHSVSRYISRVHSMQAVFGRLDRN